MTSTRSKVLGLSLLWLLKCVNDRLKHTIKCHFQTVFVLMMNRFTVGGIVNSFQRWNS